MPISALRAWMLHLGAFGLPLLTLVYLLTGPHRWWVALLGLIPLWVLIWFDKQGARDPRDLDEHTPAWPFEIQLYALFVIQLSNHVLLCVMASKLSVSSWSEAWRTFCEWFALPSLSGVTAGYSGVVLAHEFIHRRNKVQFFLGRVLFTLVCYEHWPHEHIRGHHPRLASPEDWSTARFDETFHQYFWRTVPKKFQSAWALEKKRVGAQRRFDLRNRVVQGVLAEVLLLSSCAVFFGWIALALFVLQTLSAIMFLEAVDYVEHWGLSRVGKVSRVDSWDTDNSFTFHTLIGLSRHPDHHVRASRPYHLLKNSPESPQMPAGYYVTLVIALFNNKRYRELAREELQKKQLGPFRSAEAA